MFEALLDMPVLFLDSGLAVEVGMWRHIAACWSACSSLWNNIMPKLDHWGTRLIFIHLLVQSDAEGRTGGFHLPSYSSETPASVVGCLDVGLSSGYGAWDSFG